MLTHRIEIPVVMQQHMVVLDAVSADDQVGRLASRDPNAAEGTIVCRCLDREIHSQHFDQLKPAKIVLYQARVRGVPCAPQHLQQDDVADQRPVIEVKRYQLSRLRSIHRAEIRDPDGAIDDDHSVDVSRPISGTNRDAWRRDHLPTRCPSDSPARFCRCSLTTRRNASSMVARLVRLASCRHRFGQQLVVDLDVRTHCQPRCVNSSAHYTHLVARVTPAVA